MTAALTTSVHAGGARVRHLGAALMDTARSMAGTVVMLEVLRSFPKPAQV